MTYANFRDAVLSYSNRFAATFTTEGSQDVVLAAMNDARKAAQRLYTFNLNRQPTFCSFSLVGKSLLTDFTTVPNGTVIAVKQIDGVYEYYSTLVGSTTAYYRTAKMKMMRHSAFEKELAYSDQTLVNNMRQTYVTPPGQMLRTPMNFVYLQGVKMYHSQLTTPQSYMCDSVVFLPDHDGGTSQDIFLSYFSDWLKYATIMYLNQFIKDTERIQIDKLFVDGLWESVKQYDSQQAAQGAIDLD